MKFDTTRVDTEAYFWFRQTHLFGFRDIRQPLWFGTAIWYLVGVVSRFLFIIFPVLRLLALLQSLSSANDYYSLFISIGILIAQILLGGWLVFTYFIRPNTPFKVVPHWSVRQNGNATLKILLHYSFMMAIQSFLESIKKWMLTGEFLSYPVLFFVFDCVIVLIWTAMVFSDRLLFRKLDEFELSRYDKIKHLNSATKKIKKRLSVKEQSELELLLFQENALLSVNLKMVSSIVGLAIVLELMWEIATGFGSKIIEIFFFAK